jgi:alcohol dehydrogenase class IV
MRIILSQFQRLEDFLMDPAVRKDLLYASMLAGIVISQTGTTLLHGLGYALTCNRGISHGRANGMLFPAYLKALYTSNSQKLDMLAIRLGLEEFGMLPDMIGQLFPEKLKLSSEELRSFVEYSISHKSIGYTPADFDREKIQKIFESVRINEDTTAF